jgi:hypothetical protein
MIPSQAREAGKARVGAGHARVLLALLAAGCTITTETAPPPPPPLGDALVDWTVAESKDPRNCDAFGAATLHVALYDTAGALAGSYVQDCAVMATTIAGLAPDTYTGHAELLDAAGNARTTSIALVPFDIFADATSQVALDFPASSFR